MSLEEINDGTAGRWKQNVAFLICMGRLTSFRFFDHNKIELSDKIGPGPQIRRETS
jgi:hypothetical protein